MPVRTMAIRAENCFGHCAEGLGCRDCGTHSKSRGIIRHRLWVARWSPARLFRGIVLKAREMAGRAALKVRGVRAAACYNVAPPKQPRAQRPNVTGSGSDRRDAGPLIVEAFWAGECAEDGIEHGFN